MGEAGCGDRGRTEQPRVGPWRAARRRLVVAPAMAAVLAVVLTGCLFGPVVVGPVTRPDTGRDDRGVTHHGPTPTARSVEDGVEV